MAIKKSDLYSSLWASCDELRGGMDASQYKDYVLFMLFIKYISDKYGNSDDFAPPVIIPKGAGFRDMVAWYSREVWDLVAEIGGQVPLIYWSRTRLYGLREWDLAQEAAEKLIAYGRPYSAITLLAFALQDAPDTPSWEVAINALEAAPATDPDRDPTESLQYHLEELLDRLTAAGAIDDEKLARIEWIWLPLLEDTSRSVAVLHRELARNPGFFVEVAGLIYVEPGAEEEQSAATQLKARHAQRLLASWRSTPGTSTDGLVDPAALSAWVTEVLDRAGGEPTQQRIEYEVGQVLARSPIGTDGHWPHEGVRNVIEELESEILESSVETGRFNGRGVTMRNPLDGGDQETTLAERYEADARALAPSYPRTAAILRSLARTYRNMARREDTSAELREDMER